MILSKRMRVNTSDIRKGLAAVDPGAKAIRSTHVGKASSKDLLQAGFLSLKRKVAWHGQGRALTIEFRSSRSLQQREQVRYPWQSCQESKEKTETPK